MEWKHLNQGSLNAIHGRSTATSVWQTALIQVLPFHILTLMFDQYINGTAVKQYEEVLLGTHSEQLPGTPGKIYIL